MKDKEMKRVRIINSIFWLMVAGFFLSGCSQKRAGLEIKSLPVAKVYLNGVDEGKSPYKNANLEAGRYQIKLEDEKGATWQREIILEEGVTVVVNRKFGEGEESGYILSMERSGREGSILVSSSPDGAVVSIDGEVKNMTPTKIEKIEPGDRKVTVSFPGYKNLSLVVKMLDGYQLVLESKLETEDKKLLSSPSPVPTQTVSRVRIKSTPTGWLRVRAEANNNSSEIGRVLPGQSYEMMAEEKDWYQISFEGKEGWVSANYAEKT